MPEHIVPNLVVPEPQPVVHEPIVESKADIKPVVVAPAAVPKVNDEDIDEDKEPKMDPEELDHMEEDIDAVAPKSAPAVKIAQIAAMVLR